MEEDKSEAYLIQCRLYDLGYLTLNPRFNYIVSGIERSGTSLMMQILEKSGIPIKYDNSRVADEHNPYGYYELFNGKIIDMLKSGQINLDDYRGVFIKITSEGIRLLPDTHRYKIIYMLRNIDEVIDSSIKIGMEIDDRDSIKKSLINHNIDILEYMKNRKDIDFLVVDYNKTITQPKYTTKLLSNFLNFDFKLSKVKSAIDVNLYRNRA